MSVRMYSLSGRIVTEIRFLAFFANEQEIVMAAVRLIMEIGVYGYNMMWVSKVSGNTDF